MQIPETMKVESIIALGYPSENKINRHNNNLEIAKIRYNSYNIEYDIN